MPGIILRCRVLLVMLLACTVGLGLFTSSRKAIAEQDEPITVYQARKIITMDRTNPQATAVAVRGKRVVAVGSMADLKPWLDTHPHRVDRTFARQVLIPGLVDPHLHPLLGAIQLGTKWITPESWILHDERVTGVTTPRAFKDRLRELLTQEKDKTKLFVSWGWSAPYHGPLTREMLNDMSPEQPVFILQRSVHEGVFNDSALAMLKLTEEDVRNHPQSAQADWDKGHFIEGGFFEIVMPRLAPILFDPELLDPGYDRNTAYLLSRGVTTVGDMSTGAVNWDLEMSAYRRNIVDKNAPLRVVIVPDAFKMGLQKGGMDNAFSFIDSQLAPGRLPHPLVGGKRVKLFSDGAMFSLAMQLNEPGYVGFGTGEWITQPEAFEKLAHKYWREGYKIHVHANGDKGADFVLDVFEALQDDRARRRNSLALEHYGYGNERLNRRIAELGAAVSANPYYVTFLGDGYSKVGLGPDRARRIAPIRGLVDRGVLVSLHSDFGMAPADPLALAWAAITRETLSGKKMVPPVGLTLDEAMRAITIDAAHHLGLEKDIGTIEAGKLADFTVLDKSPYDVGVTGLRDLKVWGVVFEGRIVQAYTQATN